MSASIAKRACCCDSPPEPCDPRETCGVLAATICIAEATPCATPPPEVELAIGPGSVCTVSCNAKFIQQDARLYGTAGPYTAVDPGNFPDDPDFEDCEWTHSYESESDEWLRGRKLCKTILYFEDVEFVWQLNPRTCTFAFCALGVECEVGVPADIEQVGTEGVGGTVAWKREPDATETMTLDLYLGFVGDILWCPGEDASEFIVSIQAYRTDGAPFDLFFNEDWLDDDGLVGSVPHPDTMAFPAEDDSGTPSVNEAHAWPFLPAVPGGIASDRSYFIVNATLHPFGTLMNLAANGTRTTVPSQASDALPDDPPLLGFASAVAAPWEYIAASTSLDLSNRTCESISSCTECNTSIWHSPVALACAGKTLTYRKESHFIDTDCAGSSDETTTFTKVYKLKCTGGGTLYLGYDWTIEVEGDSPASYSGDETDLTGTPGTIASTLMAAWLVEGVDTGSACAFPGPGGPCGSLGCTRDDYIEFLNPDGYPTLPDGPDLECNTDCTTSGETTPPWSSTYFKDSSHTGALRDEQLACASGLCAGPRAGQFVVTAYGRVCGYHDLEGFPFYECCDSGEFQAVVWTLTIL